MNVGKILKSLGGNLSFHFSEGCTINMKFSERILAFKRDLNDFLPVGETFAYSHFTMKARVHLKLEQ